MKVKANHTTSHRGLLVEHWTENDTAVLPDNVHNIVVRRALDQDKSASLEYALETGSFSNDDETPLSEKEYLAVREIEKAYEKEGLW
jgi:hypothetical protein